MADKEDGVRFLDCAALPVLMALSLYGGYPIIDTGAPGYHYLEVFDNRIGFHRLIANAKLGQAVRLPDNHRDIRFQSLSLIPGRSGADRKVALEEAMRLYRVAASHDDWVGFSPPGYRALLEAAFKRLDAYCGIEKG